MIRIISFVFILSVSFFVGAAALASSLLLQTYYYPNLKVVVEADNWPEGLVKAGRICFKALTRDKYPGEEEGLRIIDICANPSRKPL